MVLIILAYWHTAGLCDCGKHYNIIENIFSKKKISLILNSAIPSRARHSRALASVKGGREKKEKGGKGGKEKERGKKEKINAS